MGQILMDLSAQIPLQAEISKAGRIYSKELHMDDVTEPTWDDMYLSLAKEATKLTGSEEVDASGVDDFLDNKIKVASLGDLSDFFRIHGA